MSYFIGAVCFAVPSATPSPCGLNFKIAIILVFESAIILIVESAIIFFLIKCEHFGRVNFSGIAILF